MGKTSRRRATQIQENNVGCTWGLIRMFYSRRDPKLILDRKQGSRRHSFSGFAGRGHSRNKSTDFEEPDEGGDNMEERSTTKPTVKRLMEGELGKLKQSKKIPNDEVRRILADLGHDVCLDKGAMQNSKPNGVASPHPGIGIASSSGSFDPGGSNCMKQAEEDGLELALSDFMGQVYKYHDEGPHDDCRNTSELYPELESIIHTKINEYNNPPCDLDYQKTPVSEEKQLVDNKYICNRHVGARLEPKKMLEKTNVVEHTKASNQRELAIKTKNKESRNIFFWKKDKSSRTHAPEGRSSQPVNKIVILKPNPRGGFDPTEATASTSFHRQSGGIQAPEYSAAECSTFSVKEVRRRFRIVTGETREGRPPMNEDDVQRDPCLLRDSFTIIKDSRQAPPATDKNDARPSNSSKHKQINDSLGGFNSDVSTSKDASTFYAEAKKHLTEILKDNTHTGKYPSPAVQVSRSLVGMLSLPQCSTPSSPGSTPRVRECIEHSQEEKNICAIQKTEGEESAEEGNKSEEDSGSAECGTSEVPVEKTDQEKHYKEEDTQQDVELDTGCIEEIDNLDHSQAIRNAQCISAEQHKYNSPPETTEAAEPGKEHAEICPGSPKNVVKMLEHQEPETPRRSASLGPTSQEENHEKQEQPSPVSILDPFFHEDDDSPENKSPMQCELRQDVSSPHRYYQDDGSDPEEIFWEDKDVRLGYIETVLELSELCTYQNLDVWYLEDELVSPCLFEELLQGNHQTDDFMLFFDCICEAITAIQGKHFGSPHCLSFVRQNIQAPPMGQKLISEINKHIEGHLCYEFPSTLNQLINMDLEEGTWMDLRSESEETVVEIWEFLLDELLEDVAYDLWI
ncbi:hypothetical protein CFC21_059588 [Triticum aestivum]|uniref:DUF4378 domain-containing protein n=3 Tax=Triticum TaxID=4564 RepID=A0A9R0WGS6_TRITD|nr:uncharacterized protein LOC123093871 [Triticum aestivum]XP_044371870.1 uncharacterized protein LOC123093871 [Triticum aestivum]XP_044371871.1 uncharacterized protein LOC123093871 [Triticum aestivum]KAF7051346.1 hypothetical protein CFC21_059588 [Triticum aestivum]VAI11152.1 unnamed protein product [Triticum turgidum subsp. durum]